MRERSKKRSVLILIAGICFLLSGLPYVFQHGVAGFTHPPSADGPVVAGARLVAGTLFVLIFIMDMRKPRTRSR